MLLPVNLRLLAPAAPVNTGHMVTVRASFRSPPSAKVRTTWDWDDGLLEEAELAGADPLHTHRAHLYGAPGVYRVRVAFGTKREQSDDQSVRYVTVRRDDQVGASGWVRDADTSNRVPFGFLVTPAGESGEGMLILRYLIASEEVVANRLTWLFADEHNSLHFGGQATIGERIGDHPFRVDVRAASTPTTRIGQQLAISLYAPGSLPGRDSPLHRISGPIRPGRVDLGGFVRPS